MDTLRLIVYLFSVLSVVSLIVFILFLTIKKPSLVRKNVNNVHHDKSDVGARGQAFLLNYYLLDYLKGRREFKTIYYIGLFGVIGTTVIMLGIIIYIGFNLLTS